MARDPGIQNHGVKERPEVFVGISSRFTPRQRLLACLLAFCFHRSRFLRYLSRWTARLLFFFFFCASSK